MKNEQINTGYPHIDKPWMKFYPDYKGIVIPKTNMTEYLRGLITDNNWWNLISDTYYGREITYQELFYNIDKASTILEQAGIKKGQTGMNLVPDIPEAGEIWLGATQIGAISDFIDPRPDSMNVEANAKKVLELLKYERANYIVALDICYLGMLKPIENELKDLGIDTIITLKASDRMNFMGKIDYLRDALNYNSLRNIKNYGSNAIRVGNLDVIRQKLKAMQEQNKAYKDAVKSSPLQVLSYGALERDCQSIRFTKCEDVDAINYIGHTSGTSGARPKPITTTNKAGISTLEQLKAGNITFNPGDRVLRVLPLFAPFGAYDNYMLNYIGGSNNINIPEFEINEFGYLIKKYRPNVIMATPAWLAALPDCRYLDDLDLSCITTIIYGGDSMSAYDEERVNKWLCAHGSSAVVEKGHGMSEFLGCGSYAQDDYNPLESIGIPMPETIYSIVDPNIEDHLEPLKFNEGEERLSGELVVSSDAVTEGILYGDTIVPHYDMDGKSYIRTRDIASMDRDGIFYHHARKDRSFTRFDGYKIKPYEIEAVIEKNPMVREAMLVPYFDENQRGIMPICHLTLTRDDLTIQEQIKLVEEIVYKQIIANPDMASRQIPSKFRIRKSMPISKNGKGDFKALEAEGLTGNEICVDVKETNLAVDHIDIYVNGDLDKPLARKRQI